LLLALPLALALAALRLAPFAPLRALGAAYVEVVRGVPLLAHLLFWYFAAPELLPEQARAWLTAHDLEFWCATAALTLYIAAYLAEDLRHRREVALKVLHPDLASLGVRTTSVLHVIGADGVDRVLTYDGNPDAVDLDPAWYQTLARFTGVGFEHILTGYDHLLFVVCLVLGVRRWQSLVAIISAFTLAHSITLAAAAVGITPDALWFPPLVEVLIAGSIVWLAIENVVLSEERLASRWPVAFGFGLVHGFGFSFALGETLQFAGGNLVSALLAFNVGVELGQLLVLLAAVPVLWLVRRYAGPGRERLATIALSVIVAHTGWHWLTARVDALAEYRGSFTWPVPDAIFALLVLRLTLLAAVAVAVALALRQILRVTRRS
jgi:His/Glu/Gln/Arg/opine family amino acid ABC transporter permease subunit